jgi:hypothetical protein
MRYVVSVLIVCACLSSSCHNTSTTTITPTSPTAPYSTSDVFTGTLDVEGSSFSLFTPLQSVTTTVALGSLTVGDTAISVPMSLGLGTTDGTNCNPTQTVTASPGLTAQITTQLNAGTYCVKIADQGNLTTTTNFAVRINNDALTPSSSGQTSTDSFPSLVYPQGVNTHYFGVNRSGTLSVTLSGVSPPVPLGLAIGISGSSSPQCNVYSSQAADAGGTLDMSAAIDKGIYCVKVYDVGQIADRVRFTLTVVHP